MKGAVRHYGIIMLFAGMLTGCLGTESSGLHTKMDLQLLQGKQNVMPVAVIGSGPAGLMGALYTARGGKKTYIIEGNKPGGLLMDTTEVENWPGSLSIPGPTIIDNLRTQASHQGAIFVEDVVERIDCSAWPYTIYTERGTIFHAMTIIIATGASPRTLGVSGEATYWGGGVTACAVCDAPFYKGADVVVVGGGDSAIEEAIQLASYAKKITILVRKDHMRAAARMQERLKAYPQIGVLYNVEVQKVVGKEGLVTGVELYNTATEKMTLFQTSGVFLAIGHDPNSGFAKETVTTDAHGYIQLEGCTQKTSILGLFAAGDVADFRYRQAGTAAGQGIAAGLDAVRFLDEIGFNIERARQYEAQFFRENTKERTVLELAQEHITMLNTLKELQELIKTRPVVVLDVWAEDCPACRLMKPTFERVASRLENEATFAMVNSDEAPEIINEFQIHRVPTILIFKDGTLVERSSNPLSLSELHTMIKGVQGKA